MWREGGEFGARERGLSVRREREGWLSGEREKVGVSGARERKRGEWRERKRGEWGEREKERERGEWGERESEG